MQLARRHSPDCIPYWADTLWISDNKIATTTLRRALSLAVDSPRLLSFEQRRHDVSLQRGIPLPGGAPVAAPREDPLPSIPAAPHALVNGRCIVKILAAIESRGPLCPPRPHAPGWLFPKPREEESKRGRGTRRTAIFRVSSYGTGRSHTSRSAVSRYVSPTALRSRRHVTFPLPCQRSFSFSLSLAREYRRCATLQPR